MLKNKKNLYLFISVIILLFLLLWKLRANKNDTASYDFAVTDTASITKIFIADRKGNSISLDRAEKNWKINDMHKVRKNAMKIILKTIKNISMQRPVSESSYNNVIKGLATSGVKIEIYQNQEGRPTRTYTIGDNTPDHTGTYMLLKDQEQPYVMHIIGFNGIMGPRYGLQVQKVDINAWRDKMIFNLIPQEIKSVSVINQIEKGSSFTIKNSNGNLILKNYQKEIIDAKQGILMAYLTNFRNINCENFKGEEIAEKIKTAKKLYSLIVKHQSEVDSLEVYQMREEGKPRTPEGNYTVERMYAVLNSEDVMLIQNYVFNKLLITVEQLREE